MAAVAWGVAEVHNYMQDPSTGSKEEHCEKQMEMGCFLLLCAEHRNGKAYHSALHLLKLFIQHFHSSS